MATPAPEPSPTPILVIETGGMRRRLGPQRAIDLSVGGGAAVAASRQIVGGAACTLLGWSVYEPTGAAKAGFALHDGSGIGGGLLGVSQMAAAGADTETFPAPGIWVATGKIYLSILSGSVAGVLYIRLEDEDT